MKGLLIGRNPINTTTGNGKTLAAFMGRFSSDELTQVFVSDLFADKALCNSFYKINEKRILIPDLLCKKAKLLSAYVATGIAGTDSPQNVSRLKKTATVFLRTKLGIAIRNCAWKEKKERLYREIFEIIQKEQFDFLFYDVGNLSAEYELILKIAENYRKPLVLYVSDDYIYGKNGKKSPKRAREAFEKMAALSSSVIVISETMKELYEKHIKADYTVAMNGCDSTAELSKKSDAHNKRIVYAGNVGLGRFDVLKRLDKALALNGDGAFAEIYSSFSVTPQMKQSIEHNGKTRFCGAVFGEELKNVWDTADVLVHVESFEKKYRTILETAISTKISEYMYTERPILIIAPPYSESARFVERNDAGTVVFTDDVDVISDTIKNMFEDYEALLKKAEKARAFAEENLSKDAVSKRIYEKILLCCNAEKKEEK